MTAPLNPYIATRNDLLWVFKHPVSIARWARVQLTPTWEGCKENTFTWQNVGSFVQIGSLTIFGVFMLLVPLLWPAAILLYVLIDYFEYDPKFKNFRPTNNVPNNILHANRQSIWPRRPSLEDGKTDGKIYFINGIATTDHWFGLDCSRLADHCGDTVTGIYNCSYGLVADLFECIVQRNFNIRTAIVRQAAHKIQADLNAGLEVLLIAHSQGGIIASLVVEELALHYSAHSLGGNNLDLSNHPLRRLSVLTFASAARQFFNPNGLIPSMRHYVNSQDLVGWSTVAYSDIEGDIEGDVFLTVDHNKAGHLFNASYSLDLGNPLLYRMILPADINIVQMR